MDRTVESVAYDLKENGYATHAIHNHRAAFYNRNSVYANLGFDDFTAIEYMPKAGRDPPRTGPRTASSPIRSSRHWM